MAVYQGGNDDMQAARTRKIIYSVGAVIIVIIVVAVGFIWIRQRGANTSQEIPAPPPVQTAVQETTPTQPPAPQGQAEPAVTAPEAPSAVSTSSPQASPPGGQAGQANQAVSGLIAQAMSLLNQQPMKVVEARDRLNEILPMAGGQERAYIKEQLTALSDKWLFSKVMYPDDKLCAYYKVNPGDKLTAIGKQFNVPYEILMQINNIPKAEALQAGATIKVINGAFNVRVYRSTFTMDLYLQNTYVKSFTVGLGKPGMETPTGRWRVKSDGKLVKPIWTDPVTGRTYHPEDKDYPLGSRWIALDGIEGNAVGKKGFAIHGTNSPEQIGTPGSQGCIRLHNGDAVTVYNLMIPGVSLVDVVD
jgi:lipoprotein-anchoring transpeptidase ErfK/SrfK